MAFSSVVDGVLNPITDVLSFLFLGGKLPLFGDLVLAPFGMPPLVLWLICGGIFFTLRLKFVNFRLFKHGIDCVLGRYSDKNDPGAVTQFQALTTAVSATVGLGNIGGVAIAIVLGGPGAVIWMMVSAFLGMSTKFAEVTLGHKYRVFHEDGRVSGGPFFYLRDGLAEIGKEKLGKILSKVFAVFCIGGAIGGGILFQSNQSVHLVSESFTFLNGQKEIVALVLAVVAGLVLLGGIKRIAHFAEAIVPSMAILYVSSALVILFVNRENVVGAISLMFTSAFSLKAFGGGLVATIMQGFRRAAFSNEAGLGSAPIAHATAKTKESVSEGSVALLEPFIDTIVICFMTGIVVVVTGSYVGADASAGAMVTAQAFATVSSWFPKVLSVAAALFAFSTMITYSFYGEKAWEFLFGRKHFKVVHLVFTSFIFIGGIIKLDTVIGLADILFLLMAIPNLLGLYYLSGILAKEVKSYEWRIIKKKPLNSTESDTQQKSEPELVNA